MAFSTQQAVSDGTLVLLSVSIAYIDRDEIHVLFDEVEDAYPWEWVGVSDPQISFSPAVPNGVVVLVNRKTDLSAPRHVFTTGAAFTAESLDEDIQQVLHIAQEASEGALGSDFFQDINMHGNRVLNIGPAIDPNDAVPLGQYITESAGAVAARAGAEAARDAAVAAKDIAVAAKDTAVASSVSATASAITATNQANTSIAQASAATDSAADALASEIAAAASAASAALIPGPTGAANVGYTQTGTGAVVSTVQVKLREFVSVRDFGASAAASAATNLAAFKLAVAATATGGTLRIPADTGNYVIDATGGLSAAIVVDRAMTLVFEGSVESNFSTMQANPPYLFKVTGNEVHFQGVGSFVGNGTFDVTNAGDETTFPGFIYVTGAGFACSGLNFIDAPKLSILLHNCVRARITGNKFSGGPATEPAYGTGYFGIRATGGSAHRITENWFGADAGGGKISNCIFFGGSQGNVSTSIVAHNVLSDSWEKLVYGYMDRCVISDNSLNYPNGNKSDAIRVMNGTYNVIDGNTIIGANGGVSIYDSVATKVRNNQIVGCKQVGIYCRKMTALPAGGFSDTEIIGNNVTADTGSLTLGDGISIVSDGQASSRVKVVANSVVGFGASSGEANIRLVGLSPYTMDDCTVVGNIIDGAAIGNNGIWLGRGVNCRVSDNTVARLTNVGVVFDGCFRSFIDNNNFRSPGLYAIDLNGGAQSDSCTITDNASRLATNVGIADFGTTNVGRGNSYTDALMTGSATLTAAASVSTITHGGVAPNAKIFTQESSSTAGALTATTGIKTSVSGNNFVLETSNGGGAAGTEVFHFSIVQ